MNGQSTEELFHELSYYSLGHKDTEYFIHQHVVDAYTAQTASDETKHIAVIYSLVGLYLFLEKGYSGREVQLAHMDLVIYKNQMPKVELPEERGKIIVKDVLNESAGVERDRRIRHWCADVWSDYEHCHAQIIKFLQATILE